MKRNRRLHWTVWTLAAILTACNEKPDALVADPNSEPEPELTDVQLTPEPPAGEQNPPTILVDPNTDRLTPGSITDRPLEIANPASGSGRLSVPPSVQNLQAGSVLLTSEPTASVSLFWDAQPTASGYRVQYRVAGEPAFGGDFTVTGHGLTVPNLAYNTTYEFRVIAYNFIGDATPSNVASATTPRNRVILPDPIPLNE